MQGAKTIFICRAGRMPRIESEVKNVDIHLNQVENTQIKNDS